MSAPETAPEPSARQLLVAAQLLACGEPPALAAAQAGLAPSALAALRAPPDFRDLVRVCEALEAMPPEAQQARLRTLTLRAVERGLAEGRAGTLAAAMRLLGLAPARPPRTAAEPAPAPPPSGERWGLLPDGGGG